MTLVVWSKDCDHAQAVLLNCYEDEDVGPYYFDVERRGVCKLCGRRLGELFVYHLEGKSEQTFYDDPSAIDLSRR